MRVESGGKDSGDRWRGGGGGEQQLRGGESSQRSKERRVYVVDM